MLKKYCMFFMLICSGVVTLTSAIFLSSYAFNPELSSDERIDHAIKAFAMFSMFSFLTKETYNLAQHDDGVEHNETTSNNPTQA